MNNLYPSSRLAAQERLAIFTNERASSYGRERNFVVPEHQNVSRLSPAITHGLITEQEVAEYVLSRYDFPKVEKFIQEVYWRRYWKGWLAMRPSVWDQYVRDVSRLTPSDEASELMRGEGQVPLMNQFVQELKETGYLHNHARMWFAAYWVHTLQLPWQLGADFFYRHLLDADPASNTLSWRWIAGLQTKGKTYLARASNIKKFMHSDLLQNMTEGLDSITPPEALSPSEEEFISAQVEKQNPPLLPPQKIGDQAGFWIHEEDLSSDLAFYDATTHAPIILTQSDRLSAHYSTPKKKWLSEAVSNTHKRLVETYGEHSTLYASRENLSSMLQQWAHQHNLTQIVTSRPEVGYLADTLPKIEQELKAIGIDLIKYERPEYEALRPFSQAGFFGFWKKAQKHVL